jgi:GT2 family glycosyltransferase
MPQNKIPFVSIQVINWNGKRFLKDCFDDLLKQDYKEVEIVLVDNGSTDDSIDFMKKLYPREIKNKKIRILSLGKNYGFAGGYNISYKKTNADFVLLINNDIRAPNKNFLSLMIDRIKGDDKLALVGASIFPMETDLKKTKESNPTTLSVILTNTLKELKDEHCLYTSGCCCLIKKKAIEIPFDSDYFLYSEDVYLGLKTNTRGYYCVEQPKAKILHYGSGTAKGGSPFVRYYAERNRIINYLTFFEKKNVIKLFPIMCLYFLVSSLFFIQRPKVLWSFIKAHFYILTHMSLILKKRRGIQAYRKISDEEILSKLSSDIFITDIGSTSYGGKKSNKTFLKNIIKGLATFLNKLSGAYCKIINIKTL